jgi:hypothetical protein
LESGVLYFHATGGAQADEDLEYCPFHTFSLMISDVLMYWIEEENPENNSAFDFSPQPYEWRSYMESICDVV